MGREPAVIFDRDGTLARIDRSMVERVDPPWADFHASMVFDTPVPEIVALTHAIREGVTILVVTGRHESMRSKMLDWLFKHNVAFDRLLMRPDNDQRADHIMKSAIYVHHIYHRYDVRCVVDDRPSVCDMWRQCGLHVVQVQQPEHLPVFQNLPGE